jgi:hypothetical protein
MRANDPDKFTALLKTQTEPSFRTEDETVFLFFKCIEVCDTDEPCFLFCQAKAHKVASVMMREFPFVINSMNAEGDSPMH